MITRRFLKYPYYRLIPAAVLPVLVALLLRNTFLLWPFLVYVFLCTSLLALILFHLFAAYVVHVLRSNKRNYQTSAQPSYATTPFARLRPMSFTRPDSWPAVLARREKERGSASVPKPLLFPEYPRASIALDTIISYVIRDFLLIWYREMTDDRAFVLAVERAICSSFAALGARAEEIDILQVLTSRIIPALTRHIQNFQRADQAVRRQQLGRTVRSAEELNELLASKYREGRLHPAVTPLDSCTSPPESVYFRKLLDCLLPHILPPVELQSRCLRLLVREIVSGAILKPLIDMLSDPDYWNQMIYLLMTRVRQRNLESKYPSISSPYLNSRIGGLTTKTFEDFLKAIKDCDNLVECKNIRNDIVAEMRLKKNLIKDKRPNDVVNGQKVKHILVYINRLWVAKKKSDKRVSSLGGGSMRLNRRSSFMRSLSDPIHNFTHITLRQALIPPSGLSCVMEYMERLDNAHQFQFWYAAEQIRQYTPDDDTSRPCAFNESQLDEETLSETLGRMYTSYFAPEAGVELGIPEPLVSEIQQALYNAVFNTNAPSDPQKQRRNLALGTNLTTKAAKAYPITSCPVVHATTSGTEIECMSTGLGKPTSSHEALTPNVSTALQSVFRAQLVVETSMISKVWPLFQHSDAYQQLCAEYHMIRNAAENGDNHSQQSSGRLDSYVGASGNRSATSSGRISLDGADRLNAANDLPTGHDDANLAESPDITATPTDSQPSTPMGRSTSFPDRLYESNSPHTDDGEERDVPTAEEDLDSPPVPRYPSNLYNRRRNSFKSPPPEKTDQDRADPSIGHGERSPQPSKLWEWTPQLLLNPFRRNPATDSPPGPPSPTVEQQSTPAGDLTSENFEHDRSRDPVSVKDFFYDPLASPPPNRTSIGLLRSNLYLDRIQPSDSEVSTSSSMDDYHSNIHLATADDLLFASELAKITSELDGLVEREEAIQAEILGAEKSGDIEKEIILRREKAAVNQAIKEKKQRKIQCEKEHMENILIPGRTTVHMRNWTTKRDSNNKDFAMYAIDVSHTTQNAIPVRGWVVERRYSEFRALHDSLKETIPEVSHYDFPGKRPVLTTNHKFVETRKTALQGYIRHLLQIPAACKSNELRDFLCRDPTSLFTPGSRASENFEALPGPSPISETQSEERPGFIRNLYKTVSGGLETQTSRGRLWDFKSSKTSSPPSGFESPVTPAAVGPSASTALPGTMAAELRAVGRDGVPSITASLCDLFSEVFDLEEKNNWLRRRSVINILQQLFEGTVERKMRETIDLLFAEDVVERIRDALWPGGQWPTTAPTPRTAKQKQHTKSEAHFLLTTFVPDLLGGFVVRQNARRGARRVFNAIQNPKLNRHLVFCLLDEIVLASYGQEAADVVWTRRRENGMEKKEVSRVG